MVKTNYFAPQVFGIGASEEVGTRAKELKITKAIVVYDKGVKASGIVDPILLKLKEVGIDYVEFDGVLPDPPDYICDEAGALAVKENVNGIIAVGGGSSMDTAKAVRYLLSNPPPINKYFGLLMPNQYNMPTTPLIAIPTSAGTGSEATLGAVITDCKNNKKAGLFGPGCFVSVSLNDPKLYCGMPPAGTAACAFDAYTHAFDAICRKDAMSMEKFATLYATESIKNIHKYLLRAMENGQDLEAREGLAFASTLAGYAINTVMCHLTHAVGHTVGSVYHKPHGLGCALCLPQLAKFYAKIMPERVKIAAEAMGLDVPEGISNEDLGIMVADCVRDLMKAAKLPTFKQMGISLEDTLALIPKIMEDVAWKYGLLQDPTLNAENVECWLREAYDQYELDDTLAKPKEIVDAECEKVK